MPRREILSPAQREALLVIPVDRAGLIKHYVLGEQDISLIHQRRGDHNRLGIAVQLALLRFPGTALQADETPPKELINFLALQLHVPSNAWDEYAQRDETRREHLLELQTRYGFRSFILGQYRSLATWLLSTALQTNRGIALVRAAIEELRRRSVIVPRLPVLERLCAETALRAQRQLFETLSANLTDKQRRQLDALLEPHEDHQLSVLAWLRLPSGVPSPRNILIHIERLQRIRAIELPLDLGQRIHQNRLLQLAREGAATTIQHLARFDDERRYGSLVAILLETTATLTDEILDLHDRFIGSLFNKAKRKHDEAFQASGKAINEKVRLYAQIGQALLAAKRDGVDPFAAIEEIVSWEEFTRSVSEAERLACPEDFDFLGLITDGYSQLRCYAPTLLETFDFRAAPVVTPLMDAIETLRVVNLDKVRTIPGSANTDFVSRRWRPYVFTEQGIDRRFYELCVLSELKNRLRSGDVWVVGSRQFKDFDTYLLDSKRFAELRDQDRLSLNVFTDGNRYLSERCSQLEQALGTVDTLAQRGELPDAAIAAGELKIAPLTNTVPEEATALMRQAYALLPHIKITDLLLEVDRWTGFSRHFTHLKTGQPCKDPTLLLTAILADAINLGIAKMAEACPGTTARKLDWIASLYVRDETYAKALGTGQLSSPPRIR